MTSALTPAFSRFAASAFCAASSASPNQTSLVNAIFLPSGDQTGPPAPVDNEVSARGLDPSGPISQTCGAPSFFATYASVFPSGDQRGSDSPSPFVIWTGAFFPTAETIHTCLRTLLVS